MFYQFQHITTNEYIKKEYGRNFNFPAHLHQCFEFITVFSGEMTVTVDDKPYLLKPGVSLLIFPHQIHSLASTDSSHMLCIFPPELIKAYSCTVSFSIPETNLFSPDEYIIHALDKLTDSTSLIEKKGLLYSLCAQFDKKTNYISRSNTDENILNKIFRFVELNYNNECSLQALAKELRYSYSYLSRYFKDIVGISFSSYVNHYRISNACYLLSNSNLAILQCALECGYDSLRSFNRNFKKYLMITPNEYRKNINFTIKKRSR